MPRTCPVALGQVAEGQRQKLLDDFIQEGALLADLSERSTAIVQARDIGSRTPRASRIFAERGPASQIPAALSATSVIPKRSRSTPCTARMTGSRTRRPWAAPQGRVALRATGRGRKRLGMGRGRLRRVRQGRSRSDRPRGADRRCRPRDPRRRVERFDAVLGTALVPGPRRAERSELRLRLSLRQEPLKGHRKTRGIVGTAPQ